MDDLLNNRLVVLVILDDVVAVLEQSLILDLKASRPLLAVLNRAEVDVPDWVDRVLAEHSVHVHVHRDLLELVERLPLKNLQPDVGRIAVGDELDLLVCLNRDTDLRLLVGRKHTFHRRDRE
jgi:hypothetical protein